MRRFVQIVRLMHSTTSSYRRERSSSLSTFRRVRSAMVRSREYFPFQELLNRCINLEIHPLSLSSVFNVLYCIHAWLQNDTHNGGVLFLR